MRLSKLCRFALLLGVSFLNAYPSYCLDLSGLRTLSRTLANDSGASRRRFSDSQINTWLNEGQRQAIARTWCIEVSTSFQLASGTTYYVQNTNFLAVRRFTRDFIEIPEMSVAGLDSRSLGWQEVSGKPNQYFIHFSSRGAVGVAPFPGVNTDTATIRMDYFASANDMSSDTSSPFNGIPELVSFHEALSYFAAARMAGIDGRLDLSQFYNLQYEGIIKVMGEKCKFSPNYFPALSGQR